MNNTTKKEVVRQLNLLTKSQTQALFLLINEIINNDTCETINMLKENGYHYGKLLEIMYDYNYSFYLKWYPHFDIYCKDKGIADNNIQWLDNVLRIYDNDINIE